jgi:hypothetical protein
MNFMDKIGYRMDISKENLPGRDKIVFLDTEKF